MRFFFSLFLFSILSNSCCLQRSNSWWHENMGSQYYNLRSAKQTVGLMLTACHCLAESCILTLMEVTRLNCLSTSRRSVLQIALIKKRAIIPEIEVGRGRPTFLFALRNCPRQTGVRFGFGDSLHKCHFVWKDERDTDKCVKKWFWRHCEFFKAERLIKWIAFASCAASSRQ